MGYRALLKKVLADIEKETGSLPPGNPRTASRNSLQPS